MNACDRLPGGKGDDSVNADFDEDQLRRGMEVELEHTDDVALAMEIARDHLTEDPEYYTKLAKMEGQFEDWQTENYWKVRALAAERATDEAKRGPIPLPKWGQVAWNAAQFVPGGVGMAVLAADKALRAKQALKRKAGIRDQSTARVLDKPLVPIATLDELEAKIGDGTATPEEIEQYLSGKQFDETFGQRPEWARPPKYQPGHPLAWTHGHSMRWWQLRARQALGHTSLDETLELDNLNRHPDNPHVRDPMVRLANQRGQDFSDDPVSDHVVAIQSAIDNIHTDAVTPEHIEHLAASLGSMPTNQAMAVAQQVGIRTATSRRQAAERLRQKLRDLYFAHRKSRMYGGTQMSERQPVQFSAASMATVSRQLLAAKPADYQIQQRIDAHKGAINELKSWHGEHPDVAAHEQVLRELGQRLDGPPLSVGQPFSQFNADDDPEGFADQIGSDYVSESSPYKPSSQHLQTWLGEFRRRAAAHRASGNHDAADAHERAAERLRRALLGMSYGTRQVAQPFDEEYDDPSMHFYPKGRDWGTFDPADAWRQGGSGVDPWQSPNPSKVPESRQQVYEGIGHIEEMHDLADMLESGSADDEGLRRVEELLAQIQSGQHPYSNDLPPEYEEAFQRLWAAHQRSQGAQMSEPEFSPAAHLHRLAREMPDMIAPIQFGDQPPGLEVAESVGQSCAACQHFGKPNSAGEGKCKLYDYMVKKSLVCSMWQQTDAHREGSGDERDQYSQYSEADERNIAEAGYLLLKHFHDGLTADEAQQFSATLFAYAPRRALQFGLSPGARAHAPLFDQRTIGPALLAMLKAASWPVRAGARAGGAAMREIGHQLLSDTPAYNVNETDDYEEEYPNESERLPPGVRRPAWQPAQVAMSDGGETFEKHNPGYSGRRWDQEEWSDEHAARLDEISRQYGLATQMPHHIRQEHFLLYNHPGSPTYNPGWSPQQAAQYMHNRHQQQPPSANRLPYARPRYQMADQFGSEYAPADPQTEGMRLKKRPTRISNVPAESREHTMGGGTEKRTKGKPAKFRRSKGGQVGRLLSKGGNSPVPNRQVPLNVTTSLSESDIAPPVDTIPASFDAESFAERLMHDHAEMVEA